MEPMTDGLPHGMVPVSTSGEEQGLCERCQTLEIGTYLEKSGQVKVGWFAAITESSLKSDCRFCQQFCKIFSTSNESGNLTEMSKASISRAHPLSWVDDERDQKYYYSVLLSAEPAEKMDDNQTQYLYPIPIGKYVTPNIANYDMVKQALLNCEENHSENCRPLAAISSILQLIDCRTRKIIPALEGQRYVCLSYVWGTDEDGGKNSPLVLPSKIPKTIEDAMHVAIEIGIPFLWVDRYCIDQTNRQQKHTIIRNMDKIYSGANLTIISAAGEDPHHGLPGVRGTPRQSRFLLQGEFCAYIGAPAIKEEIEKSKWGSRGW
ncbi:hypothetical protein HBI25_016180 [Parastagonospora nodorum]|nr:hypothetical protein HBH53_019810 [Parastagonospora nodorum]KAH4103269.1 hypothetical protein HBH46_117030 [Parastagonospora nodorum]KAH4206970.1 hypothetical protein HBI95_110600 [Parastagonospora nodorum]KAH4417847.1 hypothetical protein HBH92_051710 [Parastagonospora nodorum]KAH4449531.1 hypothetical protein HBH93_037350 [Parastagonospora nodorum]